jgi:hypothetical protein
MTPELKSSCELIFQEHKAAARHITWSKEAFRGRISIGLCEMAKETLLEKKVIYLPKPPKRHITSLNPLILDAATFEDAIAMIQNPVKRAGIVQEYQLDVKEARQDTAANHEIMISPVLNTGSHQAVELPIEKWYLRPFYYYFLWPVLALAGSILIAHLMSEAVAMRFR